MGDVLNTWHNIGTSENPFQATVFEEGCKICDFPHICYDHDKSDKWMFFSPYWESLVIVDRDSGNSLSYNLNNQQPVTIRLTMVFKITSFVFLLG